MRETDVTIEGISTHHALVEDGTWNGWLCPWFTKDEAEAMIPWIREAFDEEMRYDEAMDAFVCEDEVFGGQLADGRLLYPIGNGSWIWREA